MREIEEIKADYVKCKDCIHENICKFADEKSVDWHKGQGNTT